MKSALRQWLPWLKWLIAAGLLAFVFATGKIDREDLGKALTRWPWLLAGLSGVLGVLCFGIFRWWVLLRSQGIRITLWQTVQVSFIGYFFNIVMPGSVGGDLVKAYYIARDRKGQRVEAISTIALDRLIGLYALLSIGALAAVLFPKVGFNGPPEFRMLSQFVLFCLISGAAVALVFLWIDLRKVGPFRKENPGPILGALRRLYDAFRLYRNKKRVLALALLLSFGAHSFGVGFILCLAQALGGSEMTTAQYLYVIPLGLVINGIPIAPGGWGLGEIAFGKLVEVATGYPENVGASLALLMHFAYTFWNLLGFLFYVGHKREVEEARLLAEEEETP